MRKTLLLLALAALALTSCQKNSTDNGPFTCTCRYAFLRGFYYNADTSISTTYVTNTSRTSADYYCTTQQSSLIADTLNHNVSCYIH